MMRFSTKLGATLKMAAAAALAVAALGAPGRAAAQSLPGGTWGLAQAVDLTALVPAGSQLSSGTNILDVSCVSQGNCGAIGEYAYTTNGVTSEYPFVVSETGGTWGTPATVAGIPKNSAGGAFVSCAASGECAAGWTYPGASGYGGSYLIDESGGVWGQAQPVTIGKVGTLLYGVSCAAAGACTAVGSYVDSAGGLGVGLPFVMDSSAGTWGAPQEAPGFAGLSSSSAEGELTSVSCTSAGNCLAGGSYYTSSTNSQPFLAIETNGSWGQSQNVAGMATLNPDDMATLRSVSCGGPGDCTAMGEYDNVTAGGLSGSAWVADESGGSWGQAQNLPAPAASSETSLEALSCPAQGFCVIAGSYIPASGGWDTAFTATYTGGAWTVQNVPGLAPPQPQSDATAVSCAAPGYCTVVGYGALAGSGQTQVFLADDVNGTWANAQGVSGVSVTSGGPAGVSCSAPGYCTAFGGANLGTTPFTMSEATASAVTLQPSAPTVTYGDEGSETLTATVTSPAGGTPTGTVTVSSGSAAVCTITLAAGTGTCTLTATQFPVGTAQLTATYNGDADYVVSGSAAVPLAVVPPAARYVPTGPVRILDTRNGTGGHSGAVGAGQSISVQVTGQNGVPASGVTAVVLNVTAVNPTAASYVTVYPDGQSRPGVSNLDFAAGQTIPNLVTVPVGGDGKIDLYNNTGSVNLLADLAGYYSSSGGSGLVPAGPVRILDTRNGTGGQNGQVGAGQAIRVQVTGQNGVPASGVTAVVLNVTAVSPTAASYVTVYPDGQSRPVVSNLDFAAGQTIPNLVIVPVGSDGKIDFYNNTGRVNLLADLAGYYSSSDGSGFVAAGPARVLDTRNGTGGHTGAVGAGQTISLQMPDLNGAPASAMTAVVLNVTAVSPTAASYVTVYPDGQTRPVVSNLDFAAGQTIPNLVMVPLGSDGKIDLYNNTGSVNLLADAAGYFVN